MIQSTVGTVLKGNERKGSGVNSFSFRYSPRSQLNDGLFITATEKKVTEREKYHLCQEKVRGYFGFSYYFLRHFTH